MEKKKVLIFPAGAENALEIFDSLRYNVNVEVFGASGKKDYAEYCYDEAHYIEGDFYIQGDTFLPSFNEFLERYGIDVVIPTHDDIALFLAQHREQIRAKVLVSDAETALVCRKKSLTFQLFAAADFCPRVYASPAAIPADGYPVFAKPDIGAGSVGSTLVCSERDWAFLRQQDGLVISEYLPGKEVTVDCFTDRHGTLRFVGPRSRDRIQMGIAFRSTALPLTGEIEVIARKINKKLRFFGAWYFQLRQDKQGAYKLMEISCRQAGTMTLYRHLGINFPLLGIFELYGIDTASVLLSAGCQIERRLKTSFRLDIRYEAVYIDFDDTIVVNGKVCGAVIRFLYQCADEGKKIVLVSRHAGNFSEALHKHRLCRNLFDEVVLIREQDEKANYIRPGKAIFIDNSFAEREAVHKKCNIPVFDVDAVDMLLKE